MARLIVTLVVVLVAVGILLGVTGVLSFQNTKDESIIKIDKKEFKEKTQNAVEKTKEAGGKALDRTGETLHKAAEELRGSPNDKQTPKETPAAGTESTQPSEDSKVPPENK